MIQYRVNKTSKSNTGGSIFRAAPERRTPGKSTYHSGGLNGSRAVERRRRQIEKGQLKPSKQ